MSRVAEQVLAALQSVLGPRDAFVALHEPSFEGNEWSYVKDCLDTGWVSSAGKYVDRFETMLAEYTGAKRAVAVVNGTAALHVALLLVGVERDDEVLMPALTFVATANAVAYCGAVPHFVDSEEKTLGLDPHKLDAYLREIAETRDGKCFNRKTGRCIRAVVPMHTFGHPVDLDPLAETCRRFGIVMVEDAAESLGSFYKGRHTGHWGRIATLSFNGNKTITTGGGGALLLHDDALADHAKHITTTGKVPHRWRYDHDETAFNYRLPNLNAALGCAQMERLGSLLQRKRKLAERYASALATVEGVRFVTEPSTSRSNYWLNAILLDETHAASRDALLEVTNAAGVMTRPAWTLMHRLAMYAACPRMDLSTSESLERRLVNIPSSASLVAAVETASIRSSTPAAPATRQDCIAIIPARGGSKRVPKKNIRALGGKPLIAYSIEAARDSGLFSRIIVSTDSEEIAKVAREHGAEVPFLRSAQLADDHTPVSAATADALDRLDPDGTRFTYVAQLMANCPFRDASDVRASFDRFSASGADAQISVVDFAWTNPWWAMQMNEVGTLSPLFEQQLKSRSQDLPALWAPTGALWWARADVLRRERTFHVAGRTGHALAWEHALDIDTETDWKLGEQLLRLHLTSES